VTGCRLVQDDVFRGRFRSIAQRFPQFLGLNCVAHVATLGSENRLALTVRGRLVRGYAWTVPHRLTSAPNVPQQLILRGVCFVVREVLYA
jgi:hypothetical protein